MFRALHFQRPMARLALIAVLLMALSPAVSRWVASGATQLLPGLVELCTMQGLKWVDVSGFGGDAAKSPSPNHAMQADCAYCPLLAGTALLLLAAVLLFPQVFANLLPARNASPPVFSSLFPGLGSRGPPLHSVLQAC